jgi:hypothetical protein
MSHAGLFGAAAELVVETVRCAHTGQTQKFKKPFESSNKRRRTESVADFGFVDVSLTAALGVTDCARVGAFGVAAADGFNGPTFRCNEKWQLQYKFRFVDTCSSLSLSLSIRTACQQSFLCHCSFDDCR